MKRALYLSHTGMTEPLGRSQVLPYVAGLARAGWEFDLVGFEPPGSSVDEVTALTRTLYDQGINYRWFPRSASHSPLVKAQEMAAAMAWSLQRVARRRPRVIHTRSYLPALLGDALATISPSSRHLFDCRGLLADEYADSGHWARTSLRYRALKVAERRLFARADAVVTLTDRVAEWLRAQGMVTPTQLLVTIPCCVDADRFVPDAATRRRAREQIGAGDRFVLAYSGNLGSYYCAEEMARLFAALHRHRPSLFLILTRADAQLLTAPLSRLGVPAVDVHTASLRPDQMSEHLQAADAGVCFVQPWFSKIASSPVKVAEYLALGLPVVMNRGVGDSDQQLDRHPGPFIDAGRLSSDELERAAAALAQLPVAGAQPAAIALARQELDLNAVGIARYQTLYNTLS